MVELEKFKIGQWVKINVPGGTFGTVVKVQETGSGIFIIIKSTPDQRELLVEPEDLIIVDCFDRNKYP